MNAELLIENLTIDEPDLLIETINSRRNFILKMNINDEDDNNKPIITVTLIPNILDNGELITFDLRYSSAMFLAKSLITLAKYG